MVDASTYTALEIATRNSLDSLGDLVQSLELFLHRLETASPDHESQAKGDDG